MSTRVLTVALLSLVLMPCGAAAQTPDAAGPALDRFTVQAGAGPLLRGGGYDASASFGFSPLSRLDLLVTVERTHLPFQRDTFSDGYSVTRGGTLTSVGGEVRVSFLPPHRVSPYGFAGIGGGVSRPTVNDAVSQSGGERAAARVFRRRRAGSNPRRAHRVRRRARHAGVGGQRRHHGSLAGTRGRRLALLRPSLNSSATALTFGAGD